jgi:hypothetical protein
MDLACLVTHTPFYLTRIIFGLQSPGGNSVEWRRAGGVTPPLHCRPIKGGSGQEDAQLIPGAVRN